TLARNPSAERVTVYHFDNLEAIPASEQWDLVVGNPPHFVDVSPGELLHRRFFTTIGRFLKPGGMIVLLENNRGSTAETFRAMIEQAGLHIARAQLRRAAHAVYADLLHRLPGRQLRRIRLRHRSSLRSLSESYTGRGAGNAVRNLS